MTITDKAVPNVVGVDIGCSIRVRELQQVFGFATPQAIYKWQHGGASILVVLFGVTMDAIIVTIPV